MIGQIIAGLAGAASNAYSANLAYKGQQEANQINREIASQNIAFQQRENDITRMREDNAIQRAALDMQAAGLSKTLAAGNPASAAALTAPQNNYQHVSPMEKIAEKLNVVQAFLNAASLQGDINKKKAEADLIASQTEGQNLNNSVFMQKFATDEAAKIANTEQTKAQIALVKANTKLAEIEGDYKAEEIQLKIDNMIADLKNKGLTANQIIATTRKTLTENFKMSKEAELVVQDIIYKKLEIQGLEHNIDYAIKHGLPVGQTGGSILGVAPSAVESVINWMTPYRSNPGDFKFYFNKNGNTVAYMKDRDAEAELWELINNS